MGAGKTTVGRKLALRLGYWFLDTDYKIEREQGSRVAELFEKYGQTHFRQLETDLLKRLLNTQNTVVATGGGLLTTPGNTELIKQIGTSVYLYASVDKLFERATRTDKRPMLRTADPYQTMLELYKQREHLYEDADIKINTESLRLTTVVREIIKNL
jgi:shikimate kinase